MIEHRQSTEPTFVPEQQPMASLKRTALYDRHLALKARMVPFGGWDMPVQYASILSEHRAVREAVGVFDVSHMGQFLVSGPVAAQFLSQLVPGNVLDLAIGRVMYTQFTDDGGSVLDDLLIYRLFDHYLLVVNASNTDKDWQHLEAALPAKGVTLTNSGSKMALLAVQGPRSAELLGPICSQDPGVLPSFGLLQGTVASCDAIVARTGYTGEDGFEVFLAASSAPDVWDTLLARGATPCGLGARDTLRLEAGLPLYGHEWDGATNPVEAGLAWTIKSKAAYPGKEVLDAQLANGPTRRLVGLKLKERAPAREGYEVWRAGEPVGSIASGTVSPTLGYPIATTFVPPEVKFGDLLSVKIRDRFVSAEVVKLPFYKRQK